MVNINKSNDFSDLVQLAKSVSNNKPLTQDQIKNIKQKFSENHILTKDHEAFIESLASKGNITKLFDSGFKPQSFNFGSSITKTVNEADKIISFIDEFKNLAKDGLSQAEINKLKSKSDSMTGFSKEWAKNMLTSISNYDPKQLADIISKKVTKENIERGLKMSESDPFLKKFTGQKKEIVKQFLQIYYTDPILLSGLSQTKSFISNPVSGFIKNAVQSTTYLWNHNLGEGKDLKNFGACQECQRRVHEIMTNNPLFDDYFDIKMVAQAGGVHNYVVITDKKTSDEYQVDPWYTQTLEGSIKSKDLLH